MNTNPDYSGMETPATKSETLPTRHVIPQVNDVINLIVGSDKQVGSIEFVPRIRSAREVINHEIQRRRVDIENEWQTTEDCLDDGRLEDAAYFLQRMISGAKRLKQCLSRGEDSTTAPTLTRNKL